MLMTLLSKGRGPTKSRALVADYCTSQERVERVETEVKGELATISTIEQKPNKRNIEYKLDQLSSQKKM